MVDYLLSSCSRLFLWTGATAAMSHARLRRRLPAPGRAAPRSPYPRRPRGPAAGRGRTPRAGGEAGSIVTVDVVGRARSASSTRPPCSPPRRSAGRGSRSRRGPHASRTGLTLPADIAGEELIRRSAGARRRSTSWSRTDGSVYGVLATADVDRAFREQAPEPGALGFRACLSSSVPTPSPDVPAEAWSGVHRGPLREGEWVRLIDQKGRKHNFELEAGKRFFSNKGHLDHDELIGRDEGFTVTSSAGGEYLVFRPLLSEFVVSMPRGAAVVYPKDAAQIVAMADIFPGARVVEAGVGSGALTCSLLRAVGPCGRVSSYERREEFAEVARRNVDQFFARPTATHPAWTSRSATWPRRCRASGERRRPDHPRHARALGVRRRRRRTRSCPAASSAPTSPPPPSCPASWRPCGRTAASPSRSRGSRWCATGTSRAWPSAPATR